MRKIRLSIFVTLVATLAKFICISAILPNLYAIELNTRTLCPGITVSGCFIITTTASDTVENNQKISLNDDKNITFSSSLNTFFNGKEGSISRAQAFVSGNALIFNGDVSSIINYGEINIYDSEGISIKIEKDNIKNIENYGLIAGDIQLSSGSSTINIINTGTMGGIATSDIYGGSNQTLIIDNRGTIKSGTLYDFKGINIVIKNYMIKVSDSINPVKVNMQGKKMSFYDNNSKIILDFGDGFELGKIYDLGKIFVDSNGSSVLDIDFSRLTTRNDLYDISNNGNGFSVSVKAQNSAISNLYKANIKTMNQLFVTSNAFIYPRKFGATNKTNYINRVRRTVTMNHTPTKRVIHEAKNASNLFYNPSDSLESNSVFAYNNTNSSLESNETFFYDSQTLLADTRAIRMQRLPNSNQVNLKRQMYHTNVPRVNQATNANKYHLIFAPFVNYNIYSKANLSGLDYGFISAFSGKLNNSNSLGLHLGFSYGNLSDKNDTAFSIKSMNLMAGLHYKLDLIWDIYIKTRGDFLYFLNEISSSSIMKTKPNNMGFGASMALGKDFDMASAGVLGFELGVDYKGLSANALSVKSALDNSNLQDYNKALYNLIYLDFGANYYKYFSANAGFWGLKMGAGFRKNLAPKLASSKVIVGNDELNMLLDNDKFLCYANAGISYVLNAQSYAMEFGLNYNGSFGDKSMSNGGSFEWRINF